MRLALLGIAALFLLMGCASKERVKLMKTYENEKQYYKRLIKTEKAQLYDGNLTKVTLTATYLNRNSRAKEGEDDSFLNYVNPFEIFEEKKEHTPKEDERFIVGIYVDDDGAEESGLYDFNLTLNGKLPKTIVPVDQHDPRLKDISFVAEWSQFFLVTFPHIDAERLTMEFKSPQYGKGVLHFAKKAKYVYTKKAF